MLILVIYDEKTAITDRFNDIRHITNVFFPDLALKVASGLSGFEEPFDPQPASSVVNNGLLIQTPQQQPVFFHMAVFFLTAGQQYIRIFDDCCRPGVNANISAVVNDKIAVVRVDVVLKAGQITRIRSSGETGIMFCRLTAALQN